MLGRSGIAQGIAAQAGKGVLDGGIVDQLKTSVGKLQRRVEMECCRLDRCSFQIGGGGVDVAGTIEVLSTQDRIAAGEKRRRLSMQFDTAVLEQRAKTPSCTSAWAKR